MFKNNKNLLIIALVAVVNALGYGIIIPVLYSYTQRFGLSDFQNGLLFAIYSVGQFAATPIIGRLSDKYGRKPMLIVSIFGTAVSFFLMAAAQSALTLFLARALDGITSGNIPVASAVISDTTEPKDRAKGFGLIGASFNFGFIIGPVISAITVGIFPQLPFLIAGVISLLAVVITAVVLPETNKQIGQVVHSKLFDFKRMILVLKEENIGITLLITLFYFLAFSLFIYAYQPFSVKVLGLSAEVISLIFTLFGIIGLASQVFIVQRVQRIFGLTKAFSGAIAVVALAFFLMFLSQSLLLFVVASVILSLAASVVNPLTQTILSAETDAKSQGSILGLQASYMSLGQILGPIAGGALASIAIRYPFLGGAVMVVACLWLSFFVMNVEAKRESAFEEENGRIKSEGSF